jgi:hypothetical protein
MALIKIFTSSAVFMAAVLVICGGRTPHSARGPVQPPLAVPVPVLPMIIEYNYSPLLLFQWIKNDPRYSMIEASITERDPRLCELILTEKISGREVYYSSSEQQVKALALEGKTAKLAEIALKIDEPIGEEPRYHIGFQDERRENVNWDFTLASEPSTFGPPVVASVQGLGFLYHRLGTTAGAGTIVRIGGVESPAEPWPEISSKPYFIAFKGAYSVDSQALILKAGSEAWHAEVSPAEQSNGAEWKLVDEHGRVRQLRIVRRNADEITIGEVGVANEYSPSLSLTERVTGSTVELRTVTTSMRNHKATIHFEPFLRVDSAAGESRADFTIDLDDKTTIMGGVVSVKKEGSQTVLRWEPKRPAWAESRVLKTTILIDKGSYSISTQISKP